MSPVETLTTFGRPRRGLPPRRHPGEHPMFRLDALRPWLRALSGNRRPRPAARLGVEGLEDRLAPALVILNTTNLTTSGDGDNDDKAFYGNKFTASVVDGVAQFRFAGDLDLS